MDTVRHRSEIADHFRNASEHAAHACLRKRPCALKFDQQNFIHLALPIFLGPAAQVVPAHQPRPIIICAESKWPPDAEYRSR